jgi:hypothetical protein
MTAHTSNSKEGSIIHYCIFVPQVVAGEAITNMPGGVLQPVQHLADMFMEAIAIQTDTVILAGDQRMGKSFLLSKLLTYILSTSDPVPEAAMEEFISWVEAAAGDLRADAEELLTVTVGSQRQVSIFDASLAASGT